MEAGKLYSCEDYFLLLYPDKETAAEASRTLPPSAFRTSWGAAGAVALLSQRFGKHVSYTEKNIPLLILNREEKYIEVLAEDRKGWIINEALLNIKEIG